MKTTNKILKKSSYKLRYFGLSLTLIALILTILYISIDLRIDTKVLAINSTFFESNWFTIIQTNIIEELMMILYILGLSLIVWSIYKTTPKDQYYILIKSAIRTFWLVIILQILSILFFYGLGFFIYLTYNLIAYQLFFLIFYFIDKKTKVQKF